MAIVLMQPHLAELIAAGEVVERPASVVKELVENAIDAGATSVTVAIERGGIGLIRVEDNGGGIEKTDIPLAFVRHATSKVRTEVDLEAIHTLGFRGEALASVSSVARVRLLTRSAGQAQAWACTVQGGVAGEVSEDARGAGTTITVQDLFYNTPARMKFLKKDTSEGTFVAEAMARLALSRADVAFSFVREGKEVFATPGDGALESAVYCVYGPGFAKELLPVTGENGPYKVHGLVSRPAAGRASRGMQVFFVNGRYVKNRTVLAALEQAYRGLLMGGRYPGAVLFVCMPPQLVDVNVHPAKTEVRFAREQEVFNTVYQAVRGALLGGSAQDDSAPESTAKAPTDAGVLHNADETKTPPKPAPPSVLGFSASGAARHEAGLLQSAAGAVAYETAPVMPGRIMPLPAQTAMESLPQKPLWQLDIMPNEDDVPPTPPRQTAQAEENAPLRLLGEVFSTYIVAQSGDALILIDKHAAHERLIYDKIACGRQNAGSQQLLAPVSVTLPAAEKEALLQNGETLADAGFEIEDFGGMAVAVRGVPADIEQPDIEGLVTELAARMAANAGDIATAKREWVLHSIACRAAIKAGERTPPGQLLRLAQDIVSGTVPLFCPHGRPVVLSFSKKELEKQFGRLG